ncbi:MAG: hypothetical protein Q9174_004570 [Haloplaca sp. 1 TL-2023]
MEASLRQHSLSDIWSRPPGYFEASRRRRPGRPRVPRGPRVPGRPRTPCHNRWPPRGIRPSAMKRHLHGRKRSSPKPMNPVLEASQRFNVVVSDHDWQRSRAQIPATDILHLLVDDINTKDAFAAQFDEIAEAFRRWERVIGPLWRSPMADRGHPNRGDRYANAENDNDTSEPFDPRRQYKDKFCGANPIPNLRQLPQYQAMRPPESAPFNGHISEVPVHVDRARLPRGLPERTDSILQPRPAVRSLRALCLSRSIPDDIKIHSVRPQVY